MSFLVLVLAVWIEKFSALRHRVQRDGGWLRELHKLEASPRLASHPWLVLVILVYGPVIAPMLANYQFIPGQRLW